MQNYFGESLCRVQKRRGGECRAKAYYLQSGSCVCGRHLKKEQPHSTLPKNPEAHNTYANVSSEHERSIIDAQLHNKGHGRPGVVMCSKLKMFQEAPMVTGFRTVLPNFKSRTSPRALGMPALSPKSLGPVVHRQPGLPDALSIENYHQFNKVFPLELDGKGNPLPVFYERRLKGYTDPVPHRHKFDLGQMKRQGQSRNKNIPVYSIHLTESGEERRYTYVQSRYFYCSQYEKLAWARPEFEALRNMISDGINLNIVGYDGYGVNFSPQEAKCDVLYRCYLDQTRPFGHELVLLTLLVLDDPEDYPWKKFRQENIQLYC